MAVAAFVNTVVLVSVAVLGLRFASNTFVGASAPLPPAAPALQAVAESAALLAAQSAAQNALSLASEPDLAVALRRFLLRARSVDVAEAPLPPPALDADDFLPSPFHPAPDAPDTDAVPDRAPDGALPSLPEVDALLERAAAVLREQRQHEEEEGQDEGEEGEEGEESEEAGRGAEEADADRGGHLVDGERARQVMEKKIPVPGDLLHTLSAFEEKLASADAPSDQTRAMLERVRADIAWLREQQQRQRREE
jgi:hypothetical protein